MQATIPYYDAISDILYQNYALALSTILASGENLCDLKRILIENGTEYQNN